MHEMSLMSGLMRNILAAAGDDGGRVTRVRVQIGALCNCSADHFREHFEGAARGTIAEGAALEIVEQTDPAARHAQDVLLDSIEVAEPETAS